MKLTARMRETLQTAARQELRRTHTQHPGQAAWPAHPATLAALVHHGLLTRTQRRNRRDQPVTIWTITDAGHAALQPPERTIVEVRLLHKHSEKGYTRQPHDALPGAGEAVDEQTIDRYAEENRRVHDLRMAERRLRERSRSMSKRLRESAFGAARNGIDVERELRRIEAELAAMEAKRSRAA